MQWTVTSEEALATVARELLTQTVPSAAAATVLTLTGSLGAGKTTLVRAIARALGVEEHIKSPTFIIASRYPLSAAVSNWKELVHIDAYRLESADQMQALRFAETLAAPNTLVVVEWPEHIAAAIPDQATAVTISVEGEGVRTIAV